jgi:hypothetical protein
MGTVAAAFAFILAVLVLELLSECLPAKLDRWKRPIRVTLIVLGAVWAGVGVYTSYTEQLRQEKRERAAASAGTLRSDPLPAAMNSVTILAGLSSLKVNSIPAGEDVIAAPMKAFGLHDWVPIIVRMAPSGMRVSATIRAADSTIIAEVHDGQWVEVGEGVQRNADERAFEVIDKYGIPVLQVEMASPTSIRLGGVYPRGKGAFVIGQRKFFAFIPFNEWTDLIRLLRADEDSGRVERWFMYPAELHPGERAK